MRPTSWGPRDSGLVPPVAHPVAPVSRHLAPTPTAIGCCCAPSLSHSRCLTLPPPHVSFFTFPHAPSHPLRHQRKQTRSTWSLASHAAANAANEGSARADGRRVAIWEQQERSRLQPVCVARRLNEQHRMSRCAVCCFRVVGVFF